jgi:hypothetical protein
MKPYRRFVLGTLSVAASACSPTPQPGANPSTTVASTSAGAPAPTPLVRMLRDPVIWGRDFPLVIASLPAFEHAGDTAIVVSQSRAVGSRSFESVRVAESAANELARTVAERRGMARQGIAALVDSARRITMPQATAVPDPEASTTHVGWANPSLQFLMRSLPVATVKNRLGDPERITKLLIDSGGERRPVVLTLYHFANDAVVFAESDWAAKPGLVDRVFLNVARLTAALYQEGR